MPAFWSVIPFVLLLALIATGPLLFHRFWDKYYPVIATVLGAIVGGYYIVGLHDVHHPVHALAEYASFITLLAALFVVSGGIHIRVERLCTPLVNCALLLVGALLANVIGTTGASMLLVRPFIRLNRERIKPYHLVFFIFIVSNAGGSLTPIGDPPLFLGFLKGVPFQWTMVHVWPMWLFMVGGLLSIFYFIDRKNFKDFVDVDAPYFSGKITILGWRNLFWLLPIIGSVFVDPSIIPLPSFLYIGYDGGKISYLREAILLAITLLAYLGSDKRILRGNGFQFEPIKEVAFLFLGIFFTMMPALYFVGLYAQHFSGSVNEHSLYWFTGGLSGVLDNAPTYLNFLSAAMGKLGFDIDNKAEVASVATSHAKYLLAISASSVFFGACTYIGNAPNFMVRSIAVQQGIDMPSFGAYIWRYTLPILLPLLVLCWVVFFVL